MSFVRRVHCLFPLLIIQFSWFISMHLQGDYRNYYYHYIVDNAMKDVLDVCSRLPPYPLPSKRVDRKFCLVFKAMLVW